MPTADYRLKNGTRVSGVTTILSTNLAWNKQALMYWAWAQGKEGKDYRKTAEDAATAGTICHAMIEHDLKGKDFKMPDAPKGILEKAETAFLAYLEWKDLVGIRMIASETPLVSERYGFGGTVDVTEIKKVTCILDLKTSANIYTDHRIQVAAYGKLWNENYPENPVQAYYLLQLGKEDGSFAYHYWPSLENEWKAFTHLLELHKHHKTLR